MGYTALITGANRGIGLGLVEQLASKPEVEIVFAATRNPNAPALAKLGEQFNGKIHPVAMEVVDEVSVAAAVKEVEAVVSEKGLDILINNAGINQKYFGPIAKTPIEDFKHTFDVNFIGVQNVTSAFLPLLRQGTKKIIVDISTFLASLQLNDGRWKMYAIHAYNVSKAALNFLARSYAVELVDEGFTVIAMNPGYVRTDMSPGGMISVEESATGITNVTFDSTTENGEFYQWDGSKHPW